jgi:hypothetical protein
MTVINQNNKVSELGNGSKVTFSFSFKIFDTSELVIYKVDVATGVATGPLTLDSDYTATVNSTSEGGTVTYSVAPTSDEYSLIKRIVPYTQSADLQTEGTLPAIQLENQLDLMTMMVVQLKEITDRSITLPVGATESISFPSAQASYLIGWNSTGDGLTNYVNTSSGIDATLAAQVAADAAQVTTDAAAAAASAAAAAASAASISLPSIGGNALKILRANSGATALEYKTIEELLQSDTDLTMGGILRFKKGANVASANTIALGADGNVFNITGTTQINTITIHAAGTVAFLYFAGALTLSTSGNLKMPGSVNYTTAANDLAILVSDGTYWHVSIASTSTTQGRQLFTSSGTFNVPSGVTKVYLTMVAGGGGGAGGAQTPSKGGGGGGGGASLLKYPLTVTPGAALTVTIGAGGAGGTPANIAGVNGTVGGNTSFDSVTVSGGGAGQMSAGAGLYGAGGVGAGGFDASAQTGGTSGLQGGNGADADTNGGGGGGGTPFGAGGTGANNANSNEAGHAATANTGAGGGAGGTDTGGTVGGNGGSGFCLVEW